MDIVGTRTDVNTLDMRGHVQPYSEADRRQESRPLALRVLSSKLELM